MERKCLNVHKSAIVKVGGGHDIKTCIMFLQNVYVLTSLPLKSIQLNNQKINYVLFQLQYVKYLNKASYLRKNDVVFMMKLGL